MADNAGVRRTGNAIVVSVSPDVCLTNGAPVPYPIIGYFSDILGEVPTVRMTGMEVISTNSRVVRVVGDDAGGGGGLVSGVNLGYCRPITHCATVRAEGAFVIHHSAEYWMNCDGPEGPGNTVGRAFFLETNQCIDVAPDGSIVGDTSPPVVLETAAEESWWSRVSPWRKDRSSTDTSAARTAATKNIEPFFFQRGVTSSGDSAFLEGSLVKGRDPSSGVDVDILGASLQGGLQNEAKVGLAHVGISSDDGSKAASMDIFSVRANLGVHNDDGGSGVNVGLSATIISAQGTLGSGKNTVTLGVGAGAGAELQAGIQDSDADGRTEVSFRVGRGFVTAGFSIDDWRAIFLPRFML